MKNTIDIPRGAAFRRQTKRNKKNEAAVIAIPNPKA